MKTLDEEIESRLAEILPDNREETPLGLLQWHACRAALLSGKLLLVLRRPGGFPETHVLHQYGEEV